MKNPIEMILDENNNDPIVLYDEDGDAVSFEQVAVIPLHGELYVILRPIDPMDGVGEGEALVFAVEEVDGDDVLEIVDDDDIIDEVFEEYYLLLEEDDQ